MGRQVYKRARKHSNSRCELRTTHSRSTLFGVVAQRGTAPGDGDGFADDWPHGTATPVLAVLLCRLQMGLPAQLIFGMYPEEAKPRGPVSGAPGQVNMEKLSLSCKCLR
jgi:hypothetical protein